MQAMRKCAGVVIAAALLAVATGAAAQDHQARESSGTAWQPSATPMEGIHATIGDWMFMGHANVFAQFLYESGDTHRTSRQAGSINWFMGMLRRPVGRGRVGVQGDAQCRAVDDWRVRLPRPAGHRRGLRWRHPS